MVKLKVWFDNIFVKMNNLLLHVTEDHQWIICNFNFKDVKTAFSNYFYYRLC